MALFIQLVVAFIKLFLLLLMLLIDHISRIPFSSSELVFLRIYNCCSVNAMLSFNNSPFCFDYVPFILQYDVRVFDASTILTGQLMFVAECFPLERVDDISSIG